MTTKHMIESRGVQWCGPIPRICQLCKRPFRRYFVDARVPGETAWCVMCLSCFGERGARLGLGFGQMYEVEEGKKVAG